MVHAGTHVYFDDPRVQVLVDHEVVADHFEEPLFTSDTSFARLDAPHNNVLYLFLDNFPLVVPDIVTKSLHFPHSIVDDCSFVMLLDGVVGQVHKLVLDVVKAIVIGTKTEVTLFIEPNHRRVKVFDQDPLSDVKFLTIDQQRVLDILLNHKLNVLPQAIVCDVV